MIGRVGSNFATYTLSFIKESEMTEHSKADNASETGVSIKEVSRAEHTARDDATKSGEFTRGDRSSNTKQMSEPTSGSDSWSVFEIIFGKHK